MGTNWTKKVVQSRIQDPNLHIRYAAGSPNKKEVTCYAHYLPENCEIGVVMGMTPELRNMAAKHCELLISVDVNEASIEIYQNWLKPELRSKEKIIHGDWFELQRILPEKPAFVIGDGVFGNVIPINNYVKLLSSIRSVLAKNGCFVTRQSLMPVEAALPGNKLRDELLESFRLGTIDEAELGLTMRLQGYTNEAYDSKSSLLDNKIVFEAIKRDMRSNVITLSEYEIICRYFFEGINSLPSKKSWEKLLLESGFEFTCNQCNGKKWYDWYPIYHCLAKS